MRIIFIFTAIIAFISSAFSQEIKVLNLQTESKANPLGVDVENPDFSWQIQTRQKNFLQAAYHIMIADDSTLLVKAVSYTHLTLPTNREV